MVIDDGNGIRPTSTDSTGGQPEAKDVPIGPREPEPPPSRLDGVGLKPFRPPVIFSGDPKPQVPKEGDKKSPAKLKMTSR